jgi:DMSO/TMAO reductase YedYZ molybdopterin-dependent catalytic subunit
VRHLRMSTRATNLGVLVGLLAGVATGLGSFLMGSTSARWIFWSHSAGGFALVLLLVWKRRIILRSVHRNGIGLWAIPSLLLLVLLLASLCSGILWSTAGLPSITGETGLTVHAAVSAIMAILLIPHARAGWPRISAAAAHTRRAFLQAGLLLGAGAVLWRGSELVSAATGLSGAGRRFTGSREASSFSGNDFPSNNWLLDDPKPGDLSSWRLAVRGTGGSPVILTLDDLDTTSTITATIDCTGGWYSTQDWTGMSLDRVLTLVGPGPGTRSIVVRSSTGFWRRYRREQASSLLLASQVGGVPLSHEHGAPLRIVAPGSRGYDWVKWVVSIEASTLPSWWKWPLPLT